MWGTAIDHGDGHRRRLDLDLATPGDNGTFSRTFTVTVDRVNDAPTLDAIADPAAIDEDAAPQTVNLRGITAGIGEEHSRCR